jgi:hypothetical protein
MLPMLLGLLGGGLGTAGTLGSIGALGGAALGSGLGSFAQTGDLGEELRLASGHTLAALRLARWLVGQLVLEQRLRRMLQLALPLAVLALPLLRG